jgi:hypothetical protein
VECRKDERSIGANLYLRFFSLIDRKNKDPERNGFFEKGQAA